MAIANARLYEKTLELSITDPLTGLFNRRQLERRIDMEVRRSVRFHQPMSAVMIDIDYFKPYNDNYGHLAGDEALIKVARAIAGSLTRPMDLAARYGGEEFVVVLPGTDMKGAIKIAKRFQHSVQTLHLRHEYTLLPNKFITISMGLAEMDSDKPCSTQTLIDRVDKALYRAKSAGRNTYIIDSLLK